MSVEVAFGNCANRNRARYDEQRNYYLRPAQRRIPPVAGLYNSALVKLLPPSKPPATNTSPFGSNVAV
jgi:hypothetical protein